MASHWTGTNTSGFFCTALAHVGPHSGHPDLTHTYLNKIFSEYLNIFFNLHEIFFVIYPLPGALVAAVYRDVAAEADGYSLLGGAHHQGGLLQDHLTLLDALVGHQVVPEHGVVGNLGNKMTMNRFVIDVVIEYIDTIRLETR